MRVPAPGTRMRTRAPCGPASASGYLQGVPGPRSGAAGMDLTLSVSSSLPHCFPMSPSVLSISESCRMLLVTLKSEESLAFEYFSLTGQDLSQALNGPDTVLGTKDTAGNPTDRTARPCGPHMYP